MLISQGIRFTLTARRAGEQRHRDMQLFLGIKKKDATVFGHTRCVFLSVTTVFYLLQAHFMIKIRCGGLPTLSEILIDINIIRIQSYVKK